MKTGIRAALAAVLAALALAVSSGALAHDRGRHDVPRGHAWGHYKHHYRHHHYPDHHRYLRHEVIRERVIVHQPPPVIYEQRAYYDRPAIVIGVDIPPLVVPLR